MEREQKMSSIISLTIFPKQRCEASHSNSFDAQLGFAGN